MMSNFKVLFTYTTPRNADSVEWCPIAPYQNCFACGTYQQVEDNSKKRLGNIMLFSITKHELKEESSIETAGVLDMKWCSSLLFDKVVLGVANAVGEICVYYLSDRNLRFGTKISLKGNSEDFIMLSLNWSENNDKICASDSKGNITLLNFINGDLQILRVWNAHSLEAWTTCFDYFSPGVIMSGGDDSKLNIWDVRTETAVKLASSSKHQAGVTILSNHRCKQYCLASGSYDETVVLWDTRNWKRPTETISASGGLWRLKWMFAGDSAYLLAACIYGGFEIMKSTERIPVGKFLEHGSLAYGADWCHLRGDDIISQDQFLIATCSFYDKKLCVSLWDANKRIVESYYDSLYYLLCINME